MSTDEEDLDWPRVLAVVVTHNGRPWLPGCLKSLAMQTYPALEVVVVDNASRDPDGVLRLVQRLLPTASVLRLESDTGFGSAANRALELAPDARSAGYYLFMHDDVALDRDCVGMLVSSALETNAGVVGGKGLSWDEPEVLLEVGMSADEFGYPVSGLEEGEIDQAQHDIRREVLFVTSACILVSRATIERCGSWDVGYVVFAEDLDLCIRARMCGFGVIVAPKAVFYHAIAMATGRREDPPKESVRYYTRRNRMRTIAKNTAATRVLLLLFLYTGVLSAEVVLLAALRRFDEIPPYLKAYGWFLRTLPDVARRRRAVQRRREVPDRRVRRYMVRDLPRARIFLERRLVAWGEETVRFGAQTFAFLSPAALSARLRNWVRSPSFLASATVVLLMVVAARHVLLGPTVGAGSIWPFPNGSHHLIADYLAGWREIGLGTAAPPPPALPLLWLVEVVSTGNAALAQRLLVLILLVVGLAGVRRFVKRRTAFPAARIVALAVYALGPVLRLGIVTADLGALALYALAPFLLDTGLRMLSSTPAVGGVRPAADASVDSMSRLAIRLGLLSALAVSLAPSSLVAILVLWVVIAVHAWLGSDRSVEFLHRVGWLFASAIVALLVLIPWSLQALGGKGEILGPLFGGPGGGTRLRGTWSVAGFAHSLLLAPRVSLLAGAVVVAALTGAMLVTAAPRRREARLLGTIVVIFGLVAGFVAKGWLPAPVSTPALWLVFPLTAVAAASAYLVAAASEDLPHHAAGWRQSLGAVALVAAALGMAVGWLPGLLSWGGPTGSDVTGTGSDIAALGAVKAAAQTEGEFRVLWLGSRFVAPIQAAVRPSGPVPYLVTGTNGLSMLQAFPPQPGPADAWLAGAVGDLAGGSTHLAGHLLAPAAIRFVVVDRADAPMLAAVARQKDFALSQALAGPNTPGVDIYENTMVLPLVGAQPAPLAVAAASGDLAALVRAQWTAGAPLRRVTQGSFAGTLAPSTPTATASVLLAEAASGHWHATVGGRPALRSTAFGWANTFAFPAGAAGAVRIDFGGEWVRLAWVVLEALVGLLALAMGSVLHLRQGAPDATEAPVAAAPPRRLLGGREAAGQPAAPTLTPPWRRRAPRPTLSPPARDPGAPPVQAPGSPGRPSPGPGPGQEPRPAAPRPAARRPSAPRPGPLAPLRKPPPPRTPTGWSPPPRTSSGKPGRDKPTGEPPWNRYR